MVNKQKDMWKETRTTKKQLNRLKKYKAWLENETTMEFDLAIDLYKVI